MTPVLTDVWEFELRLNSPHGASPMRARAVIDRLRSLRTVGELGPNEWCVIYPYFESSAIALEEFHRELDSIDPDWRRLLSAGRRGWAMKDSNLQP